MFSHNTTRKIIRRSTGEHVMTVTHSVKYKDRQDTPNALILRLEATGEERHEMFDDFMAGDEAYSLTVSGDPFPVWRAMGGE